MVWVKSEYAGELAVLSTWLGALLPWSFSYVNDSAQTVSFISFRFLYVRLLYIFGVTLPNERPFLFVNQLAGVESNPVLSNGYELWFLAAGVYGLAVALSIALYVAEDQVNAVLPVDPVRLMGVLHGVTAVVLAASTWFIFDKFPGLFVPVGIVFLCGFCAMLLLVERTGPDADAPVAPSEGA